MAEPHIAHEIRGMLSGFEPSATRHFQVTKPFELQEFEGGTYGVAYVRPSKRLRHILSIDREVVMLFTSFKDQQQRTIKFAKGLIDDSEGRLEGTVAVVVHKDLSGNSKLVRWGRDLALTIIPFLLTQRTSTEKEFERELFAELFAQDPFEVTGPVSDDANFFGRRDEAQELARKLQHGYIRSLLAIRKVGKTSIINRAVEIISEKHDATTVMIDCSVDGVWKSDARGLLDAIARSLRQATTNGLTYLNVLTPGADGMDLQASVKVLDEAIASSVRPVILIFDEVDYITPGTPVAAPQWRTEFNAFWRNLRAAYQEAPRRRAKLSLLVAGVSSKWFTVESVAGEENAALAFIPEEYLSPLARGATIAMIRKLGNRAGISFDDASLELIAKTTADIPYWTRKACSHVHRRLVGERPLTVAGAQLEELLRGFVEHEGATIAEVALRHLFRVYPELRDACRAVASGDVVPKHLLATLENYGLVRGGESGLWGLMTASGLALYLEKEAYDVQGASTAPQVMVESGPTFALDEWAEEIAVVGQRRNMLEKRLRAFALNFLKLDSLQNKTKPKAKERILVVKPSSERVRFSASSAEQVLDKFLWSDLSKLIVSEWALFERVFGDRGKFEQNTDLVNDRFDAHAKKADRADLALYRRALVWLEERLDVLD